MLTREEGKQLLRNVTAVQVFLMDVQIALVDFVAGERLDTRKMRSVVPAREAMERFVEKASEDAMD